MLHVEDKKESKATEFKLNAFRFNRKSYTSVGQQTKSHHSPQEECVASGAKFKCLGVQVIPNRPSISTFLGPEVAGVIEVHKGICKDINHVPQPETEILWVFIRLYDMKDFYQIVLQVSKGRSCRSIMRVSIYSDMNASNAASGSEN